MIKDLIKLPVISERNIIMDAEGRTALVVDFTHPNAKEICTALCIQINAQNADVGKLAEEYAYKMYPKADDHANVRMRQALRESLKDAVIYGSTHSAEKEKGYEWLSPVKSEREYQEQILKRFFPEYPNICHWQVMNALIMCLLKNENIERSAEKESLSGWISVEDRLPNAYQICLVVMNGTVQNRTAQFMRKDYDEVWSGNGESPEYWFDFGECNKPQVLISDGVSHWQPMPSLPSPKNK
jgi:hypothetical protein